MSRGRHAPLPSAVVSHVGMTETVQVLGDRHDICPNRCLGCRVVRSNPKFLDERDIWDGREDVAFAGGYSQKFIEANTGHVVAERPP